MNYSATQKIAPSIIKIEVPENAADWQMYDPLDGAEMAATKLGATLRVKLTAARLDEDCNLAVAARIRDEMYLEMARFSKFGASDTEPECVLVDAIEKAFGLERHSLSR
jgi:hypothetical protein